MVNHYQYEVEGYAQLSGLHLSVLQLNQVLKPYGYEFVRLSLEEFDKNYRNIFGLPVERPVDNLCRISHFNEPVPEGMSYEQAEKQWKAERLEAGIPLSELETIISDELYEILSHVVTGGRHFFMEREIILLRKLENFEQAVNFGKVEFGNSFHFAKTMHDFANHLICALRLLKNGDINLRYTFQIATNTRKVISRFIGTVHYENATRIVITPEDIPRFNELMQNSFAPNNLTQTAWNNFNAAYQLSDYHSRYLLLMACLESLFSEQSGGIAHTIARHLSLALTSNLESFQKMYSRLKELYQFRNKMVHEGKTPKELVQITLELQDYVRSAIIYCSTLSISKQELFRRLNARGFT